MSKLPELHTKELALTRDYLREVCLVLSSAQRAFLPKHPRQWQYGLEVSMRGAITQSFKVGNDDVRILLDLPRHRVVLNEQNKWLMRENPAPQILKNITTWLAERSQNVKLDVPDFAPGIAQYDQAQSDLYAEALWWMEEQFRPLKISLNQGVTSPILLYPHHFDLSLTWFPYDDERQLAIGWSTGDDTVPEPYIYLTAYPEPAGFKSIKLPKGAHWQTDGFSGAILPYEALAGSSEPEDLFRKFTEPFFNAGSGIFEN